VAPATGSGSGGISVSWPLILAGLLVLGLSVPAGIVFGLLSTRRLTRRLRRLTASTLEVAGGDFEQRIPVAGRDELTQLEVNFNKMAEQLHASLDRAQARGGERAGQNVPGSPGNCTIPFPGPVLEGAAAGLRRARRWLPVLTGGDHGTTRR
jgi:HAMP domain-containing protein